MGKAAKVSNMSRETGHFWMKDESYKSYLKTNLMNVKVQ